MKSMTAEIAELRGMTVAELIPRYRELFGKEPRVKNRAWLWRRCAWKLQEQRCGGLSEVARRRLEELIAEIELPPADRTRTVSGKLTGPKRTGDLKVGTVLLRRWKGREIRCHVTDGGFEVDGVVYRSLSTAAHGVTGSRWNGKLFFGLTERKKKQ